jgi:hypothetical protein
MKRIGLIAILLLVVLASMLQAADNKIGLDLGLEYHSFYAFRGGPNFMDRPSTGIISPSLGYAAGDFYFLLAGEIAPSVLGINTLQDDGSYGDGTSKDEKAWTGIDLGIIWEKPLADDAISIGAEIWGLLYPNSKDQLGYNTSYITATVSIKLLALPLSPKLSFTQAFKPDDNNGSRNKMEDRYIALSFGDSIELVKDSSSLDLGVNVGFWMDNTDKKNLSAFSDVIGSAKYSVSVASGVTLWSSFNMGYVPQSDWALGAKGGDFRFWLKFGINYTL